MYLFELLINYLLIWSQCAAVRALPVHSATGHPPEIFFHAGIADLKSAWAYPAKRLFLTTTAA